jgi:hypothetical protein
LRCRYPESSAGRAVSSGAHTTRAFPAANLGLSLPLRRGALGLSKTMSGEHKFVDHGLAIDHDNGRVLVVAEQVFATAVDFVEALGDFTVYPRHELRQVTVQIRDDGMEVIVECLGLFLFTALS